MSNSLQAKGVTAMRSLDFTNGLAKWKRSYRADTQQNNITGVILVSLLDLKKILITFRKHTYAPMYYGRPTNGITAPYIPMYTALGIMRPLRVIH